VKPLTPGDYLLDGDEASPGTPHHPMDHEGGTGSTPRHRIFEKGNLALRILATVELFSEAKRS
jgi:hypothetical protein